MKRTLLNIAVLACTSTVFTACHKDDEDGEKWGNYVSNFSNPFIEESIIGKASAQMGVNTYYLTSPEFCDVYCYSAADKAALIELMNTDASLTSEGVKYLGENFYGGFTPTWFAANDTTEDNPLWYLTPISKSYYSNSSALLVNPGEVCKALFSKHIAADVKSLMSALLVDEISCMYVCAPKIYEALENNNQGNYEWIDNYVALPAGNSIQLVVYGYVDSFNVSNWTKTLNTFKNAFKQAAQGGALCAQPITLASADANGKVTVNKEWQKMDLTDLDDFYLFEVYIRVVDANGKVNNEYALPDDLKYALIDDITFTGRF